LTTLKSNQAKRKSNQAEWPLPTGRSLSKAQIITVVNLAKVCPKVDFFFFIALKPRVE